MNTLGLIGQLAEAVNTDHIQNLQDKLLGLIITLTNDIVLPIGSGLIIIAIILAGFRYLQGDAKGGKAALVAAITGLVIVLLSYFIIYQLLVPALNGAPPAAPSYFT